MLSQLSNAVSLFFADNRCVVGLFHLFYLYPCTAGIMYLQFIYQKGQLYKLRTLGKAHKMDVVQGIGNYVYTRVVTFCILKSLHYVFLLFRCWHQNSINGVRSLFSDTIFIINICK